jgi:hypothetical protein
MTQTCGIGIHGGHISGLTVGLTPSKTEAGWDHQDTDRAPGVMEYLTSWYADMLSHGPGKGHAHHEAT